MNRQALQNLIRWKASEYRKPLIIRGARQVGKTWLMKEFGKLYYEKIAYINFESSSSIRGVFKEDFDLNRILLAIQIESGVTVEAANTLIILDEIQEADKALTYLKYFQENAPEYHIISGGSLLGVALHSHSSFPVGKVDFLDLYPLNFIEFMEALGQQALLNVLNNKDWVLAKGFKDRYIQHLKEYYFVGGMPEAVLRFIQTKNLKEVRDLQKQILNAYDQDFSKHAPNDIVPRIRMLWNSIPAQLAKESKKFIYGVIRQGARAREYELALSLLIDSGLAHRVNRLSKPALPLKAYAEESIFKLYIADVGLLGAMTNLDARSPLQGNDLFQEFKGALTEQFVLQQLITLPGVSVYYWAAENAKAEIDFILQYSDKIVPLEVKAEENLRAKSLRSYVDTFHPSSAFRASMSDYRKEEWMTNIPLYAIQQITEVIE
ncbi:MAG TPA: ATP-binding protein [Puia sp.]|jgi:hypothetical protein|nr:ATP-binding protein [Puia sp.]